MAYIKEEEILALRQSADIVDIIGSYINVLSKGKNYVALCPFHDDHSPSLVISKERQIFNCFTCRTGGNVFSFVMKYENCNFLEAVRIVADKVGFKLSNQNTYTVNENYKKYYDAYNVACKFYVNNLNTIQGKNALEYLHNRGISDDIIKEFNIGFALNNKDALNKLLQSQNIDVNTLEEIGLINKVGLDIYDVFSNRIMIPISNANGQVVAFTGRIYDNSANSKYLNTKETKIFKKSNILFNYDNAKKYIRDKKEVIVVEGNMDAITVSAHGIKNVVALMGVALSIEQINMLKKLNANVILTLDNDSAGLDATVKLGELLEKNNVITSVVRLNGAKDPDEYIRKFGVDAFLDNVKNAKKYLDFNLEYLKSNRNLSNTIDLINYVKDVLKSISYKDDLTKEIVISKISKDYSINVDSLKKYIKMDKVVKDDKNNNIKSDEKISNYEKVASKVLFAMMENPEYIDIYKKRLGFFKERKDRVVASEIIYYYDTYGTISSADLQAFLSNDEEIRDHLEKIIAISLDEEIDINLFNNCIDYLLNMNKKDEINLLKEKIKIEQDTNKKVQMINKLAELKKGSVM